MSASSGEVGPDVVAEYCDADEYTPQGVICIAFDIETIGPCPDKHAMVELGAVAMAAEDVNARRTLARFEGRLKIPEGCGFEELCEKEFWDVKKIDEKKVVLACQKEPEDTMRAFIDWVKEVRVRFANGEPRQVRFVTDASYFDAGWVSYYLTKYANHHPLHTFFSDPEKSRFKPVIDSNAFNRGLARVGLNDELVVEQGPAGWFSSDNAMRKALGVPDSEKPDVAHDHRAVNDATNILQNYLIALKYMKNDNADTSPSPPQPSLDPQATRMLDGAYNATPHAINIYASDKKTFLYTFPVGKDGPLRLTEDTTRVVMGAPVIFPATDTTGVIRPIPCFVGESVYIGLSAAPPDGPVIVAAMVADYLIKTEFKHPIFCPDTNPATAVRNDKGVIMGTTHMVLRSSGIV